MLTVRLLEPEFVMVIVCAAEVEAVGVFGNVKADVERVAVGGELTTVLELAQPASTPRTAIDAANLGIRIRMSTALKLADCAALRKGWVEIFPAACSREFP